MIKAHRTLFALHVALVAVLLVGCSAELAPSPASPPTATPSPASPPTATPPPVSPPTATPSPAPTATATSTPVPQAASPPPTWLFAGGIPDRDQAILREEMEDIRAYFSYRFGVEATGFTVLGGTYETLSKVYTDVTGTDYISNFSRPTPDGGAWVGPSVTGGTVVTLLYGYNYPQSLSRSRHAIVQEYFHVLQKQLSQGSTQLETGEIVSDGLGRGAFWLVEGLSTYADYEYSLGRTDRREFLNDRFTPYEDIAVERAIDSTLSGSLSIELAKFEDGSAFQDSHLSYPLSFLASRFLVEDQASREDSHINYWRLLGEGLTWQQAFEEAFSISVDDFYTAFDTWISSPSSPVPRMVRIAIHLRLPGGQPLMAEYGERIELEDWGTWRGDRPTVNTRRHDSMFYVIYPEDSVGTGYLSLWWEGCLRGWYKDGDLSTTRFHATAVEFTGKSADIDWSLPAHPSALQTPGCG